MPQPRKPDKLKVVAGTDQPCRMSDGLGVEYDSLTELPSAPDWLPNAHAVKEWNRLGPILLRVSLLTDAGLAAFGQMCALHGKIVQLWAAGESPTGHMLSQYRNLINDFGLTPVSQGKVSGTKNEQPGNKFSRNGRRSA